MLGGISSGQDLVVSIALKPTSSIRMPGMTIDVTGEPVEIVTTGRHDPCVGLRATPIAEAMLAIVLMDHYLRHRGAERGRFVAHARYQPATLITLLAVAPHALSQSRRTLIDCR